MKIARILKTAKKELDFTVEHTGFDEYTCVFKLSDSSLKTIVVNRFNFGSFLLFVFNIIGTRDLPGLEHDKLRTQYIESTRNELNRIEGVLFNYLWLWAE